MPTREWSADEQKQADPEEAVRFARLTGLRRIFAVEWIDPVNLKGKKPIHKGWQSTKELTDDQIRAVAEGAPMLGVALDGETFVVDVDKFETATGLDELDHKTTKVASRRGFHLYYRSSDGPVQSSASWPGGDIKGLSSRATPTYAVVPGSWGGMWRLENDLPPATMQGCNWASRHVAKRSRKEAGEHSDLGDSPFLTPTLEQQEPYLRNLVMWLCRFNVRSRDAVFAELRSHVEQFTELREDIADLIPQALKQFGEPYELDPENHVQDFHDWSPDDTGFNDYLFKQVGCKLWGLGLCEDAILAEIEFRNSLVEDPIDPDTLHATCGRPGAFEAYSRGDAINTVAWFAAQDEVKKIGGVVPRTFKVHRIEDRYVEEAPPYLVKGVIHKATVGQIIGAPAGGKSFLAIDLAQSVAHGLPKWMDFKLEGRRAIYVAMEGLTDLYMRSVAWCLENQKPIGGMGVIEAPMFSLMRRDDVDALSNAIGIQGGADLVVIDTQVLAMGSADEQDPSDMSTVFRHAGLMARELEAAVALVHHTGWANQDRERGSSAQFGAADWQIVVGGDHGQKFWTVKKLKVGQAPEGRIDFDVKSVPLGYLDQDGEEVESACAVQLAEAVRQQMQDRLAADGLVRLIEESDLTVTEARRRTGGVWARDGDRWESLLREASDRVERFRQGRGWALRLVAEPTS